MLDDRIFNKHQRKCVENRRAYLKIQAMELEPTDQEAHEKFGIRYGYVPNERRLTSFEHEEIGVMKRQLDLWGNKPLTGKFTQELGSRAFDEIIIAESMKRKRASSKHDLKVSKAVSLPNPHASTSSHMTYHAPSPPPLEDLLPGPSRSDNIGGPPYSYYPGIQAPRNLPSSQLGPHTSAPQPTPAVSQAPLGEFTSKFDLTFAKWLDDENISKAAISRLVKDPIMQPITSLLSWGSVVQMRKKLEGVEGHED